MYQSPDQRPTILAVDDCLVTQQVIKKILEKEYRVLLAADARTALDLLHEESVQLVLLDVGMPEIDGLDLCRTLRSLPQFQQLPVVMVTSKNEVFDHVQGRMAGATEYLTKPFNREALLQVVSSYLPGEWQA